MKVWLFDIDGTLIATGGAGRSATFAAVGEAFQMDTVHNDVQFAGRTDRAIAADVFRQNEIPNTPENWSRFQVAYLAQLERTLESLAGEVLAGVARLLERLQGIPDSHLGLLTGNVKAGAEAKLRYYQLWQHFRFGGFGDHSESRADVARQAVLDAERHLERPVRGDDVWVIGDTVHDVSCARAIDANVVAVATGGESYERLESAGPDVLLRDLSDLSVLEDLLQ